MVVNTYTSIAKPVINTNCDNLLPLIFSKAPIITSSIPIIKRIKCFFIFSYFISFKNSNISPGWHSNTSQMASRVENRTALAFPVFKIERFAVVIPIFSANSLDRILRLANITSRFKIIGIV